MPSTRQKLKDKTTKLTQPNREKPEASPLLVETDNRFCEVEVALIKTNPDQPRKHFNEETLKELAQSIEQKGVLQPIIIQKKEDDSIYLVAGERRLRAAKLAGLTKIPAILNQGNAAEIAIIENLQRENLNPVEEADALDRMIKHHGYSQEQLAKVIGKSKSTVSEVLSLSRLPEKVKDEVRRAELNHQYPRRLLVEVAKQKTPDKMQSLFDKIKSDDLKSDQIRGITKNPTERKRRERLAIVLDKAKIFNKALKNLNLSSFEDNDKVKIIKELENIKGSIIEILS
jgi:ParB family chromosome partitioning protein